MPNKISTTLFLLVFMLFAGPAFGAFRVKQSSRVKQSKENGSFYRYQANPASGYSPLQNFRQRIQRYHEKKPLRSTDALVASLIGVGMLAAGLAIGLSTSGLLGELMLDMGVYLGGAMALIGAILGIITLIKHRKNKGCAIAAIIIGVLFIGAFFALRAVAFPYL